MLSPQGGDTVCEGRDDVKDFADIRSAMKVLMFSDEEIWDLMKILAALLHLGNVNYQATVVSNMDASEIVGMENVARVSRLLQVCRLYLQACRLYLQACRLYL